MKISIFTMRAVVVTALLGAGCADQTPDTGVATDFAKAGGGTGTSSPSAKAAAAINTVTVCANTSSAPCVASSVAPTGVWQNVMSTTIKTSSVADLFVGASLVTGLFTSTTVTGNGNGSTSRATAMGGVSVRILLDGDATKAFPDSTGAGVTFDERIQTLTANLGNIFTDCFAQGGTTGTGCTLTPEQITIALDTTSAHSFNFILTNVGSGTHALTVQAQVNTAATAVNGGIAIANALYGLGSLTVEADRLVNSFSF
jgi:hypothetical protein